MRCFPEGTLAASMASEEVSRSGRLSRDAVQPGTLLMRIRNLDWWVAVTTMLHVPGLVSFEGRTLGGRADPIGWIVALPEFGTE